MDTVKVLDLRSSNKKKTSHSQEKNIQVVVRCRHVHFLYVNYIQKYFNSNRPRNHSEKKAGSANIIECIGRKGEVIVKQELHDKLTTKTFTFDRVYGPKSSQVELYKGVVEPIISEVLMGYNCTVFA